MAIHLTLSELWRYASPDPQKLGLTTPFNARAHACDVAKWEAGTPLVVATDGVRMLAIRVDLPEGWGPPAIPGHNIKEEAIPGVKASAELGHPAWHLANLGRSSFDDVAFAPDAAALLPIREGGSLTIEVKHQPVLLRSLKAGFRSPRTTTNIVVFSGHAPLSWCTEVTTKGKEARTYAALDVFEDRYEGKKIWDPIAIEVSYFAEMLRTLAPFAAPIEVYYTHPLAPVSFLVRDDRGVANAICVIMPCRVEERAGVTIAKAARGEVIKPAPLSWLTSRDDFPVRPLPGGRKKTLVGDPSVAADRSMALRYTLATSKTFNVGALNAYLANPHYAPIPLYFTETMLRIMRRHYGKDIGLVEPALSASKEFDAIFAHRHTVKNKHYEELAVLIGSEELALRVGKMIKAADPRGRDSKKALKWLSDEIKLRRADKIEASE